MTPNPTEANSDRKTRWPEDGMAWRIDQTDNRGRDYTLCRHIYHNKEKLKASVLVTEHSVRCEV